LDVRFTVANRTFANLPFRESGGRFEPQRPRLASVTLVPTRVAIVVAALRLNPLQPLHNGPSVFKAYRRNNPMITKVTDQTACGRASLLVLTN